MAGGFIGKGALDLTAASEERMVISGASTIVAPVELQAFEDASFELWYNLDAYSGDMAMFAQSSGFNMMANETGPDYGIVFSCYTTSGTWVETTAATTPYRPAVGQWHHAVGVWDKSNDKSQYVDGKLVGEKSNLIANYDSATINPSTDVVNVGAYRLSDNPKFFDGKVARASVWRKALSEAEIREMMFYDWAAVSGSSIDQTDCVAWYEFSDLQNATTVSDMSGSGNTGTLSSTDCWADHGTFIEDTSTLQFSGVSGTVHFLDFYHAASVYNMTVDENNHLIYESMEGSWKVLNGKGDFIINGRIDHGSGYGGLTAQTGYLGTAGGNQTMTLGPNANIENMAWVWNSDASP